MAKRSAMKMISNLCLCLLLFSCSTRDNEINQLNQRITRLEQKIDSLLGVRNPDSTELNTMNTPGNNFYTTPRKAGLCQAITKKGTPCKRKARSNNYCWQHGG